MQRGVVGAASSTCPRAMHAASHAMCSVGTARRRTGCQQWAGCQLCACHCRSGRSEAQGWCAHASCRAGLQGGRSAPTSARCWALKEARTQACPRAIVAGQVQVWSRAGIGRAGSKCGAAGWWRPRGASLQDVCWQSVHGGWGDGMLVCVAARNLHLGAAHLCHGEHAPQTRACARARARVSLDLQRRRPRQRRAGRAVPAAARADRRRRRRRYRAAAARGRL